jgi:uncharacterized Zn finger protein
MARIEVTEESVRRQVEGPAYERGRFLVDRGKVVGATAKGPKIEAMVDGVQVMACVTATGISAQCGCFEPEPCAHAVAATLAWIDTGLDRPRPDLYALLRTKDRDWLAGQLAHLAENDPDLATRLLDAADGPAAFDTSELRADLEAVVGAMAAEFDEYNDDYHYEWYPDTDELEEVLDDVEDVLDEAPDAVRELADHAIGLIEGVLNSAHCHGGELTEALGRAQDLHLDACLAGSPDVRLLAERLVSGALDSGWGTFTDVLPSYTEILGPEGLARYGELLEQADGRVGVSDYTLGTLRESFARAQGGTDAVIDLLARQAKGPHDIAHIAQTLIADGRDGDALVWIDKGLQDHPSNQRLLTLALECHQRAGRREEVLELLWKSFTARPGVHSYQNLTREAGEDAASWGTRAVAHLRTRPGLGPHTLVEILFLEGDIDAAWELVRQHGSGIHYDLRMRVVAAHAKTHPADAIPVYQDLALTQVERGSRPGYKEAIGYLRMARDLAGECGRQEQFRSFLYELRAAHPGKKAFHQELGGAGLLGPESW